MSKADQWKDFGSAVIVLKQVASPTVKEVDPHTELRYLFTVLCRMGCWMANPQR